LIRAPAAGCALCLVRRRLAEGGSLGEGGSVAKFWRAAPSEALAKEGKRRLTAKRVVGGRAAGVEKRWDSFSLR
jgi:hypothetical protein